MRVILTEVFFPSEQIRDAAWRAPPDVTRDIGFSVAWFGTNANRLVAPPTSSSWFRPVVNGGGLDDRRDEIIVHFIDLSVRGGRTNNIDRLLSFSVKNMSIVEQILRQDVFLHQSSPQVLSLSSLLSIGSYITIGSFLGLKVAGGPVWIMCFSVPGGIIVMGAASRISKGLYNGLGRLIEHAIADSGPPPPLPARRRALRRSRARR